MIETSTVGPAETIVDGTVDIVGGTLVDGTVCE
jgi:hypothetical protein